MARSGGICNANSFISAGHGNTDPGATAGGVTEAALAVELRNAVAGHFILAGYDVVKDGIGSENLPLSVAVKMIAGNAAALSAGLVAGDVYRIGDNLAIVHA